MSGLDLPKQPRTSADLGRHESLVAVARPVADHLPARQGAGTGRCNCRRHLSGIHSLVVNVSDMRAIIRLEGERVREVVMKGSIA